ncbi:hypothetical protein yc1106_02032 [Curvularia clavata]|uniref:Heterokaryon incompatibility domain-containing protein n=1 Tax=Curvularia clavata TaxID=95742 RepID=A0A9Q8Z5M7_CURCL|nr:hypothetical protein yc1106_02032 [Curvularia clavata]
MKRSSDVTLPFRGVRNDTSAYLPLDPKVNEIRYIAIDPGEGDAPLSGFLGYLELRGSQTHAPAISYQAVSYCWGEIKDTLEFTLRCAKTKEATAQSSQDAWTAQPYQITRNLDALLRALRQPDEHRVLWVDAICIAQDNAIEKTHQVSSMGLVYSSASEVLVWLGEADVYSEIMVEAHKVFARSVPEISSVERYPCLDDNTKDEPRLFSLWDFEATRWYEKALQNDMLLRLAEEYFTLEYLGDDLIHYVEGIFKNTPAPLVLLKLIVDCADRYFSRPWFRRIWVIQEVMMAPVDRNGARRVTVFSGQSQMQWNELVAVALFLGNAALKTQCLNVDFFNQSWLVLSVRSLGGTDSTGFSIEHCLSKTVAFESSDPRDRLFALLQLGSDTSDIFKLEPLLHTDYTTPLTLVMGNYRRWQLSRSNVSSSPDDKSSRGGHTSGSHSNKTGVQNQNVRSSLQHHSADRASVTHVSELQNLREEPLTVGHDVSYENATNGTYTTPRDTATFDATSASEIVPPSNIAGPLDYLIAIDTTRNDPLLQEAPSWVTNIFASNEHMQDSFSEKYGVYNASDGRSAIVRPTDSPLSLSLQGVRIAGIESVLAPQPLRDETSADLSYYMIIKPGRQPCIVSKRESNDLQKMYIESRARAKSHTSSPVLKRKDRLRGKFKALLPLMDERELRSRSIAFTIGHPPTENRRLYCTTDGDFVLTSEKVKSGDDIVILYGGRVPFVLRKKRKRIYSVLAPCFFYNDKWMKGEKLASEPVVEEIFEFI